jgi:hypothetical protein
MEGMMMRRRNLDMEGVSMRRNLAMVMSVLRGVVMMMMRAMDVRNM